MLTFYAFSLGLVGWLIVQLSWISYNFYLNIDNWRKTSVERSLLRVFLSVLILVVWSGLAIFEISERVLLFHLIALTSLSFSIVSLLEVMQTDEPER